MADNVPGEDVEQARYPHKDFEMYRECGLLCMHMLIGLQTIAIGRRLPDETACACMHLRRLNGYVRACLRLMINYIIDTTV